VQVEDGYRPVARWLLAPFAGQRIRLIIGVTKIGFSHRLMVIGLAYRKRTLALAEGEPRIIGWVRLTERHNVGRFWLILHWKAGEDEPRDNSYFRLGEYWSKRCKRQDRPLHLHFRPYP
jgi:hypothetical protein